MELGTAPDPDALAAALLQLSDHARHLSELDARHRAATAESAERITALTALAAAIRNTQDSQAEILAGLVRQASEPAPEGRGQAAGHQPSGQHRFWQAGGPEREKAIARLRSWVADVYRPGYGHLAAGLGGCWEQHPLCLYTLDWLSELWAVLYLEPFRTPDTLAGQAEWQTRLLAAAAAQMAQETARCEHSRRPAARQPARNRPA